MIWAIVGNGDFLNISHRFDISLNTCSAIFSELSSFKLCPDEKKLRFPALRTDIGTQKPKYLGSKNQTQTQKKSKNPFLKNKKFKI
jgi:hypothetical protein